MSSVYSYCSDALSRCRDAGAGPVYGGRPSWVGGTMVGAGQGKTLGKYGEAHYIAVSKRGEVFVADTLNWRIQKYVKK